MSAQSKGALKKNGGLLALGLVDIFILGFFAVDWINPHYNWSLDMENLHFFFVQRILGFYFLVFMAVVELGFVCAIVKKQDNLLTYLHKIAIANLIFDLFLAFRIFIMATELKLSYCIVYAIFALRLLGVIFLSERLKSERA